MIQRIQSLYLLLASLLMLAVCFFPILWVKVGETGFYTLIFWGVEAKAAEPYSMSLSQGVLAALTVLSVYAPFRTLLAFKNRRRQMRWALCSTVLILAQLTMIGITTYLLTEAFAQTSVSPNWTLLLPPGAVCLCVLAYRAIKRDDNKIRSIDRIR